MSDDPHDHLLGVQVELDEPIEDPAELHERMIAEAVKREFGEQ